MLKNCQNCQIEAEWRERYILAEKRFDKALRGAEIITLIAAIISFCCLIITMYYGIQTQKFINGFEYVEETAVEIEQTDGVNTAIIGGESKEVNIYGPENNGQN